MKKNITSRLIQGLKKFGRSLLNAWPLKLTSLFFAVVMWSFILAQTNPLRSVRVSDISIQLTNQSALANNGLILVSSVEEALPKVWAIVKVPLQELDRADEMITVSADLRGITEAGTVTVPVTVTTTSSGEVVEQSIDTIQIEVENRMTRTFPLTYTSSDTLAEGYFVHKATLEPASVTITGPESVIESIDTVTVPVSLSGVTGDIQKAAQLQVLDAEGASVNRKMLSLSTADAIVALEIYRSREVSVLLESSVVGTDSLAEGYRILSMEAVPSTVTVTGRPEDVDDLEGVAIDIVDIKGCYSDVKTIRALRLPNGVTCEDSSTVNVVIRLEEVSTVVTFDHVPIRFSSLPEGLELAETPVMEVTVDLEGPESTLSGIDLTDIRVEADLSECIAGRNTVPLKIVVSDSFRVQEKSVSPITIEVSVQDADEGENTAQ